MWIFLYFVACLHLVLHILLLLLFCRQSSVRKGNGDSSDVIFFLKNDRTMLLPFTGQRCAIYGSDLAYLCGNEFDFFKAKFLFM